MIRFFMQPALHFLMLGVAIYGVSRLPGRAPATVTRAPIVVDAARLEQLAVGYAQQAGTAPTRAQLSGLVAAGIDDELLAREARVAGLDRGDRSIRLRLVEKMRAVSDDPTLDDDALERAALALGLDDDLVIRRLLAQKMRLVLARDFHPRAPSEAELTDWLAAHHADYELPPSVRLTQIYLSARRHGERSRADAETLLARLSREEVTEARAASLSDPFVLGTTMLARSRADLARQLGDGFAEAVMALPVGRWSGPIASPFGLHLVRIDARRPATLPSVDAVRRRLRVAVEQAQAQARMQASLSRLRGLYRVRVDEAAMGGALRAASEAAATPVASADGQP